TVCRATIRASRTTADRDSFTVEWSRRLYVSHTIPDCSRRLRHLHLGCPLRLVTVRSHVVCRGNTKRGANHRRYLQFHCSCYGHQLSAAIGLTGLYNHDQHGSGYYNQHATEWRCKPFLSDFDTDSNRWSIAILVVVFREFTSGTDPLERWNDK